MSRRKVQFAPEDFLHVYNRGANRHRIFSDRDDYLEFLWRWREFVPADTATVLCYCLMPNHFHFLIQLQSNGFPAAMQRFGTSY
ncbi:MAG: transposase, partial [Planctomycetia bacterium]|nr:transposase [Planctomycetia bacterium]